MLFRSFIIYCYCLLINNLVFNILGFIKFLWWLDLGFPIPGSCRILSLALSRFSFSLQTLVRLIARSVYVCYCCSCFLLLHICAVVRLGMAGLEEMWARFSLVRTYVFLML